MSLTQPEKLPDGWTMDDVINHQYRALAEDLGKEYGHAFGWKRQVADRLGIGASHLSRILSGEKRIGVELAQRAAERLRFDFAYFVTYGTTFQEYVSEYARLVRNKLTDLDGAARAIMGSAGSGKAVTLELAEELAVRVENSELVLRTTMLRGAIRDGDQDLAVSRALALAAEITSEAEALRSRVE